MADTVNFSLIGLDSLLKKFEEINYQTRRKSGRAALRKAAMIVVAAAKQNALAIDDQGTGRSIADNVALRWNGKEFKSTGNLAFRIGILHGAKLPEKGEKPSLIANAPTPHWRLLEFGTEKMRARPFFRSALENNINPVTDMFIKEFEKSIDRAIKKANR